MNPNNYATLEASRRLREAGIALETEFHWIKEKNGSFTLTLSEVHYDSSEEYPAPCMAEVWRELPGALPINKMLYEPCLHKDDDGITFASYSWFDNEEGVQVDTNPTDALISLLIWVRGKKEAV